MIQPADHSSLTHDTSGLVLGYLTVAVPMVVGLVKGGAPVGRLLLSPVLAVPVTLMAVAGIAILSPLLHLLGVSSGGILQVALGAAASAGIGYASGFLLARRRASNDTAHRRGAVVSGAEMVPGSRSVGASPGVGATPDPNTPITLAGIPVATEDETKHFKLIGTTGTGKSTAIREILSAALARGDRAVIADPDGGYLGNFYAADRGDVILNPFDPDSVKWSLFAEIRTDYDVEQVVRSLIPDNGGPDRSWTEYARTFLAAVIQQCVTANSTDDIEIDRLLTRASLQELKKVLAGTAAGPFLETGNERMFGSVRSVTSSAVAALKYTGRQQATLFSIRDWVSQGTAGHTGGRGGVLFIPYKAGEIAALRSAISAWMRIAIFEAMNRGEGDQRLWFVVDELDALGEIDGLKDALARLRKFGGRCVLGFQSIAQVSGTYGKAAADTIVENCGNTLVLRCSASEQGGTSQFASRLIGQREVMHMTRSQTRRPAEWLGSTTTSQHISIEPAVMASEVERLADLEGFLKFASRPDWRRVRLTAVRYPVVERGRRGSGSVGSAQPAAARVEGNGPRTEQGRRARSDAEDDESSGSDEHGG